MAEPVLQEDVLVNFVVGDERLVAMAAEIAKRVGVIQSETEKLTLGEYFGKMAAELTKIGPLMQDLAPAAIMSRGIQDTESILKNIKAIGASAGMSQKQFADMNAGIAQAAAETGQSFDAISKSAADLYGQTGLKEGLGQTVLDAERLGMVFDVSGASFSKLTASMVQFGDGAVKADDVMKSFDKTTGLTGKRMDDMLEALTDISKTMRNVVGGGKSFGESMKKITEFSGQVASQFTEMGGDGNVLNQLMKDVMDPNKWGDIAEKMPGMAGNLYDMQQAMASGDMDKFGKLMQAGAQQTADMGQGMGVVARSAAGIDFSSAEMLTKVDFKKMGKDAASGGDVMTRASDMVRSVGEQWTMFMNNMSKSLMPVLMPVLSALSTILGWMNKLMNAADGWVGIIITWGIILTGLFVTITMMVKKLSKDMVKGVAEGVAESAKGLGKGVGEGIGAMIDTIGKAASKAAAYALPMMQVGAALLFMAGAVWVLAEAMATLAGIPDLTKAANGLLIITGVMLTFGVAAALLSSVAPAIAIVGLAFLVFAAAVWVLAKAMTVAAPAFDSMVTTLGRMGELDMVGLAGGIYLLSGALAAFLVVGTLWATVGILAGVALLALSGVLTIFGWAAKNMGNTLTKLPDDLRNLYDAAMQWVGMGGLAAGWALASLGESLVTLGNAVRGTGGDVLSVAVSLRIISEAAFGLANLNSLDMSGLFRLANGLKAFAAIKIDVAVSKGSLDGIIGLITIVKQISDSIVEIVSAGTMAVAYGTQMSFIFDYLFNKNNGILVKAVADVDAALQTGINKDLNPAIMDSLKFILTIMGDFSKMFIDLASMGAMMAQDTTLGTKIKAVVTFAITTLQDIVQQIDKQMAHWYGNDTIPKNVFDSLNNVMVLMSNFSKMFIDLSSMGTMMASDATVGPAIKTAINFAINTLKDIVDLIDEKMVSIVGNTTIPTNVFESMKGVLTLVDQFSKMFIDLAVMGSMLASGAGQVGGVKDSIDTAISSIFGADGFVSKMINGMKGQKADSKAIADVSTSIKSIGDMVNPLIEITSMGALFKGGEQANLNAFAESTSSFLSQMAAASGKFGKEDLDKLTMAATGLNNFGNSLASLKQPKPIDLSVGLKPSDFNIESDVKDANAAMQKSIDKIQPPEVQPPVMPNIKPSDFESCVKDVKYASAAMQKSIDKIQPPEVQPPVIPNIDPSDFESCVKDVKYASAAMQKSIDKAQPPVMANIKPKKKRGVDSDLDDIEAEAEKIAATQPNIVPPDFSAAMSKAFGDADVAATIGNEVKINTQTGADLALSDHTTATAEHQYNVEALLESIRDSLQGMGRGGSKEVAMTNGNTPAWRPEALFSDVSETF